jgi:hypothetical protein
MDDYLQVKLGVLHGLLLTPPMHTHGHGNWETMHLRYSHMLVDPLSPILPSFPFASKFSSLYHREDMGKIRKGWEVGVALSGVVCAIILHTLMSGLATERKLPKSLKHRRISICYKCQPEILNFCFACPESKHDLIWYLQSFKRSSKLDTYRVASFWRGRL